MRDSQNTRTLAGRIIDYLEESGQLDNTIVLYAADNSASGEGSPNGSVNENKFFNGYPDSLSENMKYLDVLGSPETYNHYPTGWAVAFSTPFKMFKRYSEYSGGTAIRWLFRGPKVSRRAGRSGISITIPPISSQQSWISARAGDAQGL
jgi:arylsulfatase